MKKPESVKKTEGNDASHPRHMAEQPLSLCYKRRPVTSEGHMALSFLWLSPQEQKDHPGSHHPYCCPPLLSRRRDNLLYCTCYLLGKGNGEKLSIFPQLRHGHNAENSTSKGWPWLEMCSTSPAVKALGAPLLRATGIEALYSFIKENLDWTSKSL